MEISPIALSFIRLPLTQSIRWFISRVHSISICEIVSKWTLNSEFPRTNTHSHLTPTPIAFTSHRRTHTHTNEGSHFDFFFSFLIFERIRIRRGIRHKIVLWVRSTSVDWKLKYADCIIASLIRKRKSHPNVGDFNFISSVINWMNDSKKNWKNSNLSNWNSVNHSGKFICLFGSLIIVCPHSLSNRSSECILDKLQSVFAWTIDSHVEVSNSIISHFLKVESSDLSDLC